MDSGRRALENHVHPVSAQFKSPVTCTNTRRDASSVNRCRAACWALLGTSGPRAVYTWPCCLVGMTGICFCCRPAAKQRAAGGQDGRLPVPGAKGGAHTGCVIRCIQGPCGVRSTPLLDADNNPVICQNRSSLFLPVVLWKF